MKRKIFSKLLMVALVIAAVGSFVSCKDYDDDINNLQKQIDAKAALSELTALQSTLDSKISTAQSAAAAAQATADAAATKTAVADLKTALEAAIADAKKAGTDAGTQAGTAIAAANKAQETAEAAAQAAKDADAAAKTALADALKTIEETYQTKAEAAAAATEAAEALAAVKTIAEAAYTKAEAEKLQEQVNNLKADLESQIEEKVNEAIKNVGKATASVAAIWSAVTSVELVYARGAAKQQLFFYQGKQLVDYTFGKETADMGAAQYQEYKKGDDIIFRNNVIVRVNPVNADLTPDMIKLMNSKGENLDGIVKIQKVEKYDQLLTRANETGLWQITFAREEAAKDADFANATNGAAITESNKRSEGKALFAIAINNTSDADAARYAVSPYNFTLCYGEYVHTNTLNFKVNDEFIWNLKNRWDSGSEKVVAEDNTKAQSPKDWMWNNKGPAELPVITTGDNKNVAYDSRLWGNYIVADVNEPIKITGIAENFIDYYYVVLDKDCAIESNPSELRAWTSYEYEGLNTKVESGKDLNILITDKGSDPTGDIIGFRVYAVNYDGLLADPDGRAFYVQVGETKVWEPTTKTATFNPKTVGLSLAAGVTDAYIKNKNNTVIFACDFKDLGLANDISLDDAGFPATLDVLHDSNVATVANDTKVAIRYLSGNTADLQGKYPTTDKVNSVSYVAITVQNPDEVIDGASFITDKFDVRNPDTHGKKIGEINFKLTKGAIASAVPTSYKSPNAPFAWKSDYAPVGGVVTLYPGLDQNAAAWANGGAIIGNNNYTGWGIDLTDYSNNLNTGLVAHEVEFDYAATDYTSWIGWDGTETTSWQGARDWWNANPTMIYEHADVPTTWSDEFDVKAGYVGAKPKFGSQHTVVLTITTPDDNGVQLSRVWDYASPIFDANNLDASTMSYTTVPDYTVVSQSIQFDDIMQYETYTYNHTYTDGTVGAAVSTLATKANSYWIKWTDAAGAGSNLYYRYASSTDDGNKITAAAAINHTTKVASPANLLNVAKNSVVPTFGPQNGFDPAWYVDVDYAGATVVSANGAVDEFLAVTASATDITIKQNNAVPPTKDQTYKIRIKCTDAFNMTSYIEIPFFLSAAE